MVVQIGKDKVVKIKKNISRKICRELQSHSYETGGIIGVNSEGVICEFQIDDIYRPCIHEYYPNVEFLNRIINSEWSKRDIRFVGFVHSHLNNDKLSRQDYIYGKRILDNNKMLNFLLLGIVNLSSYSPNIKWWVI